MLDVALLMANASQLKAMLEQGPSASFYTPIVALISISLFLQVAVGILLIFIGKKIKLASPPTGPFFVFCSVHLTPLCESIMTSRLTPNKQSDQTCCTRAESLHQRAEIGSEFARLVSSRECSEECVILSFLKDTSKEGMFESVHCLNNQRTSHQPACAKANKLPPK